MWLTHKLILISTMISVVDRKDFFFISKENMGFVVLKHMALNYVELCNEIVCRYLPTLKIEVDQKLIYNVSLVGKLFPS